MRKIDAKSKYRRQPQNDLALNSLGKTINFQQQVPLKVV